MKKTVEQIIEDVLTQEGGFVDDPRDAGGATNMGISLRYAKGVGLDLDHDGDTDRDDIMLVTKNVARTQYERDFYFTPRIDKLPEPLQPQMVDFAVNAGPPKAIECLQRALNRCFGFDLDEDGVVGPGTRKAAERAVDEFSWVRVNNALVDVRCAFYRSLASAKPRNEKFLAGWLRRAESFRA